MPALHWASTNASIGRTTGQGRSLLIRDAPPSSAVMAGLVPAIHVLGYGGTDAGHLRLLATSSWPSLRLISTSMLLCRLATDGESNPSGRRGKTLNSPARSVCFYQSSPKSKNIPV